MTRARKHLTLTYAQSRRAALQQTDRDRSRFVDEIPPNLLDWGVGEVNTERRPFERCRGKFRRGMTVRHSIFGDGDIVAVEPDGKNEKVTVVFQSAGRKKLIARYADLEILGNPSGS
jgi:DNA helicase-2/ATP-dependent DNA helicase PcrA